MLTKFLVLLTIGFDEDLLLRADPPLEEPVRGLSSTRPAPVPERFRRFGLLLGAAGAAAGALAPLPRQKIAPPGWTGGDGESALLLR